MLRQPIKFFLICLLLVGGCALPVHRNNSEPAEQSQTTAANPPWIKYEGLDEYPVAKLVCAVGLKVAAAVGTAFMWVMESMDDDSPPSATDEVLDQAAQAKRAEQWRLEQSAKLAAQKQTALSR